MNVKCSACEELTDTSDLIDGICIPCSLMLPDRLGEALQRAQIARPEARVNLHIESCQGLFFCFVVDSSQPEGNARRMLSSSISKTDLRESLEEVIRVLDKNTENHTSGR